MTSENSWVWLRSNGKLFKVISNPNKGTIEVLNEKGETMLRRTNLSRRQVENVEKNFLNHVAKRVNGDNKPSVEDSFDPMVA